MVCSFTFGKYLKFLDCLINVYLAYFWLLEANIFFEDITEILANISKHICKHNAFLLIWQHFEKQYDKTTQFVSASVQNHYIFNHITCSHMIKSVIA